MSSIIFFLLFLLLEKGFKVPGTPEKKAYLIEKGASAEKIRDVLKEAQAERAEGKTVAVSMRNKNAKFQKDQLAKDGYTQIIEVYKN